MADAELADAELADAGKTMLAERLPGLLPPLTDQAALEVTAVHSLAGLLPDHAGLVRHPPYQSPHHTSTAAAMVGGGSGLARPGAVSLAHHGVLLLDDARDRNSHPMILLLGWWSASLLVIE